MKPYRIGVDARPLSTPMSGVGRLIHETLKSFPDKGEFEFILFSHRPIHNHHKSLLTESNVHWIMGESVLSSKGGLYFTFELPFQIRRVGIDLFWGAQQVLPPMIPAHITCVLSYMDMVLYLYPDTMRPIARLQQRVYQSYSVNRAGFIVSISENTKNDMIDKFGYPTERSSVAYPGIDPIGIESLLTRKISPRIQSLPEKYILSVSTIEPRKNYGFLLEAFRAIRESNALPGISWVIAGKRGWENEEFYKELNKDREFYNDIIVLEGLEDSELHHLYKNSSLFWMASLYEGFGIPVLEALYHKKMAILSDIHTFREIGGDSLEYLPANTKEDVILWKDLSIRYLQEMKTYMGDISRFTWANSAQEIARVFRLSLGKTNNT